jgi:hypothetical protein
MHALDVFNKKKLSMAVHAKKHISNCQKIQQKVLYVHLDNLCLFIQFHEKAIFQAMQKRQKLSREKPYFNINFCLLYSARTTSRFFVEKHCADIPSEDIIVNFLFGVFDN